MVKTVSFKVWGELALFTRPELKVERLSYPFMTPSAARGIMDAILFKPQMRWNIQRITAITPMFPDDFPASARQEHYRLIGIRRNEIQDRISTNNATTWMKNPEKCKPYFVDSAGREGIQGEHRTQRSTLALLHVAYRIDANPVLTARANQPRTKPPDSDEESGADTEIKYIAMFNRRVANGQCFHRPYLGCREFACHFAPLDGTEKPLAWDQSLGLMLYDIQFGHSNRPGFFEAHIHNGALHCDAMNPGIAGEKPITIYGWEPNEVPV